MLISAIVVPFASRDACRRWAISLSSRQWACRSTGTCPRSPLLADWSCGRGRRLCQMLALPTTPVLWWMQPVAGMQRNTAWGLRQSTTARATATRWHAAQASCTSQWRHATLVLSTLAQLLSVQLG